VDITQGSPNPSLWGSASATLSNTSCHIEQYFVNHSIVFGKCNLFLLHFFFHIKCAITDITFCGVVLSLIDCFCLKIF
jgi:hypothetical protein